MSSEATRTDVPFNRSHYDKYQKYHISNFPHLQPGPTYQEREKDIFNQIESQLRYANKKEVVEYLHMRNCFQLSTRDLVIYCLKQKLPGITIQEAGTRLGYRK